MGRQSKNPGNQEGLRHLPTTRSVGGATITRQATTLVITLPDDSRARQLEELVYCLLNPSENKQPDVLATAALAVIEKGESTPLAAQLQSNLKAKLDFLSTFQLLSSAEVADLSGSTACNKNQLAYAWRKNRRIFAIERPNGPMHPAFQFDEAGAPLPIIQDVLEIFDGQLSAWETAEWFTSANDILDGLAPVALLRTNPATVVDAAEQEVSTDYG